MDIILKNLQFSLNSIINNEIIMDELFDKLKILDNRSQIIHIINQIKEIKIENSIKYSNQYYIELLNSKYTKAELINIFKNLIQEQKIMKSAYEYIQEINIYFNTNKIKTCDILISKYSNLVKLLLLDLDIDSIAMYKEIPLGEQNEIKYMSYNIINKLYNAWKNNTYYLSLFNYDTSINIIIDNLGRMNYLEKLL